MLGDLLTFLGRSLLDAKVAVDDTEEVKSLTFVLEKMSGMTGDTQWSSWTNLVQTLDLGHKHTVYVQRNTQFSLDK